MKNNKSDLLYLQEMDIQSWELLHASRLTGYLTETFDLPDSCLLLLVSPEKPEGDIVFMFEKVLRSMGLDLSKTMHIFPEQVVSLGSHQLSWIWFSGCEKSGTIDINTLLSPLLKEIEGNNLERRNLWQQICSYEK